ncbi:hypothetical protein GCM10007884_06990 [Methylobacterium brachythecii]|uniref:Uncharacterized protein n=1 Tax=Methylobacterium brachythecii TaxID=1176177 RepID=A0ABQ6CX91_9HYPH|nr:hypothetical protein GCM10007884_06990 [Methylobacterium brachythecii]
MHEKIEHMRLELSFGWGQATKRTRALLAGIQRTLWAEREVADSAPAESPKSPSEIYGRVVSEEHAQLLAEKFLKIATDLLGPERDEEDVEE